MHLLCATHLSTSVHIHMCRYPSYACTCNLYVCIYDTALDWVLRMNDLTQKCNNNEAFSMYSPCRKLKTQVVISFTIIHSSFLQTYNVHVGPAVCQCLVLLSKITPMQRVYYQDYSPWVSRTSVVLICTVCVATTWRWFNILVTIPALKWFGLR